MPLCSDQSAEDMYLYQVILYLQISVSCRVFEGRVASSEVGTAGEEGPLFNRIQADFGHC